MATDAPGVSRWAVMTAYFMIYVVWGSTYYFIGEAMKEMPMWLLGGMRFTLAGLIMLAAALSQREKPFHAGLMCSSALCGMLLLFADMSIIMLAQRYISSSLEAVLASSTLMWITLMDYPMWRRNFSNLGVVVGVVGGLAGVAMLYWGEVIESESEGGFGVLLFMVACLAWSLGSLISKYKASAYESVNAWSGTAWQMLSAGALFWACGMLSGDFESAQIAAISWHAWGTLAYLVVFGSVLAYSSYVWLLKIRPATEVGTHAYANPLVAMLLGVLIGEESIRLPECAGLLIICLSLFLINRSRSIP